jgi:GntR family transcriptional regulator
MFIVISPLNPDPMYKQVTDQIKEAIAEGTINPEEKLPSIREMSKELKISPITTKRAYADLENEGYIITRSGLGSYVADINKEKLRSEKMKEIREEISRLLSIGKKFKIPAEDLIRMIKDLGGRK